MTVTQVHKDPEALTMTITAEFEAPIEHVWQLWADPRRLERWWGPPEYPATVVEHDLTPGGTVTYFMTGPDGDRHHGWWRVVAVAAPTRLDVEDGFSDDNGTPDPDMPSMAISVSLGEQPGGVTRMAIETTFPSLDSMEQIIAMGAAEGMTAALGQIDVILAEG